MQRYPYHSGLRFSLAKAFHIAGRVSDAETVLTEIARRHPDSSSAKIQLAWISSRRGDVSGACEFLDKAVAAEPQNVDLPDARAQILIAHARYDEAIRGIEDGLRRLPSNVRWRERAVALLTQCGAADQAIRAARGGTEVDPRNANAWLVLGRTLNELRHYAEIGEIESDLRKSLELDGLLFEAADLLAMLLAEQRQYDKASKIMVDIEPRMGDPSPALGRVAWIHRQSGQKREAVDEMARVLEAYPWYGWGWSILMGWLEEDGAWDRARQLLEGIPAPMLTNTGFRLRRLWLLQKAKTDVERLDEEWDGLLRDFPEDVPLHVSRYDVLDEARRWKEAGAVIEAIAEVEPNDPVILARRCEALARENKKDAACETALRVCFLPVEEYTWPSERVWEVARDEGFAADLSLRLEQRLLAGERPTVQSVSGLAAYAMRNAKKRRGHLASRGWFPCRGARELTRLVREISGAAWDGSEHRAVIYALLCDYGYGRQVRKLSAATGSAAVTTVREWAQIGRSCLASGRFIEARRWLGTWRERAGVEMWMVANYVVSLPGSRRNRLEERYNSARDALAGLPHDHCAKYLAHVLAEACALLGRKEAFLETWESQAGYFDGTLGQGEFFKPKDRYLLAGIPEMAEDLERRGRWRARGVFWKLRLRRKVARSLPSAPKGLIRAISAPLIYIGFILAYLIMSFLMNRNVPQTGGPGGPDPTPPRLSLAAPPSPGPGRLRAPRPAQPSRSPGDLSPFALFSGDLAVKVTQSSSGGGSYGATGEVINRGTKTFHFVIVKFEFCDKSGRVVGTLMNAARRDEYVPPGAVKSFVVRGTGRLDYVKVRAFVVYAVESK